MTMDFNAAILPAFEEGAAGAFGQTASFAEKLTAGVDSPYSEMSTMNHNGERKHDGLQNDPRDGETDVESGAPEPAELNEGQHESTWADKASFGKSDVSNVDEPAALKKEFGVEGLPSAKQATPQKVPEMEELPSPAEQPGFGAPGVDKLKPSAAAHEGSVVSKPSSPAKDSGFGISEAGVEPPSADFEQSVPPVDPSPQVNEMNIEIPDSAKHFKQNLPSAAKDSGFGVSDADFESTPAEVGQQSIPPVDPSPQANEIGFGNSDVDLLRSSPADRENPSGAESVVVTDTGFPEVSKRSTGEKRDNGEGASGHAKQAAKSGKSEDKGPAMVPSSYTPPNDAASSSQASSVPKISGINGTLAGSLEPSPERLQQAALEAATVTPENEELLRLHHPCFEGVEVETFKHPDLDPVWVVRRGTSTNPLNWLAVAGRTVHLFNYSWLLDPTRETATPLNFAPDPLENIKLNPRHMLSDGQAKNLSVLFPTSTGCRVHLSGHLVMLFPTTSEALQAMQQTTPKQFGGLEVHYAAANPVPLKNAGAFGLRIRLPIATHDVLMTATHKHVRCPSSSTVWDRISSPARSIRHAMAGSGPLSRAASNMGIELVRQPVLIGKQVAVPGFEKTVALPSDCLM